MADEPKAIIPTLGADGHISDPPQILAYILNHFISAPASAGHVFVEESISLRKLIAEFGAGDVAIIRERIRDQLGSCLNRIFGGQSSVEVETVEAANGYTISISLQVLYRGTPYTLDQGLTLTSDGHVEYT